MDTKLLVLLVTTIFIVRNNAIFSTRAVLHTDSTRTSENTVYSLQTLVYKNNKGCLLYRKAMRNMRYYGDEYMYILGKIIVIY